VRGSGGGGVAHSPRLAELPPMQWMLWVAASWQPPPRCPVKHAHVGRAWLQSGHAERRRYRGACADVVGAATGVPSGAVRLRSHLHDANPPTSPPSTPPAVWQRAEPIGSEKVFAKLRAGPLQAQTGGRGGQSDHPSETAPTRCGPALGHSAATAGCRATCNTPKGPAHGAPRRGPEARPPPLVVTRTHHGRPWSSAQLL
jgi:hypothetical protein